MSAVWSIENMQRKDDTGFVYWVNYKVSLVDGEYAASNAATTTFAAQDGQFVPYDQLTEAQVVGWVQAALGPEQVAFIEAQLQANVDKQKNPTSSGGVPWAATAQEPAA